MKLAEHIDKLPAFIVVAETGKIREAAKRLHLAQPSVSRLLQTLEKAAGVRLLHRTRSGVSLTAAGQHLYRYAGQMMKELDDVEERIKNPDDSLAGSLAIGSFESLAEYLWPDFMISLRQRAPNLKVSIRTNDSKSHMDLLLQRGLDLVVDAEPQLREGVTSWKVYSDKFRFYVKSGMPNNFHQQNAGNQPLIYVASAFDQKKKSILEHLGEQGYAFKDKIALDSFTSAKVFCEKGLGIAVLPEKLAETALRRQEIRLASLAGFSDRGFGVHNIFASTLTTEVDDVAIRFVIKNLRRWFRDVDSKKDLASES